MEWYEVILECPNHSKKEKDEVGRLCAALVLVIEQVEWVLGIREFTHLDPPNQAIFSPN
jgi:hypothetical protein